MKVRIINTKENPVIIKSDKKPPFVDKPSWAKDAFLLAPYKEGYTTSLFTKESTITDDDIQDVLKI